MAFQDFDLIQERRRNVRAQQIKKRITIAVVSFIVILLLAAAAVCAVVYKNHFDEKNTATRRENKTPPSPARKASPEKQPPPKPPVPEKKEAPAAPAPKVKEAPAPAPEIVQAPAPAPLADNAVKALCALTDYQDVCATSLSKVLTFNGASSGPKEFVKASINATNDGLDKALSAVNEIKIDDSFKKAALNDCMTLLNDAKDELNISVSNIDGKDLEKLKPELTNWLSAVISYQQTCIDGIPDGEEKNKVEKSLEIAKQLTSNSLAMATQASSALGSASSQRRLLAKRSLLNPFSEGGFPTWMELEHGRVLKAAEAPTQNPNATVAKDGSGNFTTISDALAAIPQSYQGRYYIFVKEGTYDENVVVTKRMVNLTMYGVGSQKSVVTGSKNYVDGVPTYRTATFVVEGDGFMAQSLGFRNTAGPGKNQAVALRVRSDRSVFLNCRMEGYQATLYVQAHRQYYRSCYITGTVDFIFGDAAAVFQNCEMYIRKPQDNQQNTVTAQTRIDKRESTGIVLQNCHILADENFESEKSKFKSYLGRPPKEYSRTIVMETEIGDLIDPEGWVSWNQSDFGTKTCHYGEYNNKGAGAQVTGRVKWPGYQLISKAEAMNFTVGPFLQADSWLRDGEIPVRFGLFN